MFSFESIRDGIPELTFNTRLGYFILVQPDGTWTKAGNRGDKNIVLERRGSRIGVRYSNGMFMDVNSFTRWKPPMPVVPAHYVAPPLSPVATTAVAPDLPVVPALSQTRPLAGPPQASSPAATTAAAPAPPIAAPRQLQVASEAQDVSAAGVIDGDMSGRARRGHRAEPRRVRRRARSTSSDPGSPPVRRRRTHAETAVTSCSTAANAVAKVEARPEELRVPRDLRDIDPNSTARQPELPPSGVPDDRIGHPMRMPRSDEVCGLCLSPLTDEPTTQLICFHALHTTCLRQMVQTTGKTEAECCPQGCANSNVDLVGKHAALVSPSWHDAGAPAEPSTPPTSSRRLPPTPNAKPPPPAPPAPSAPPSPPAPPSLPSPPALSDNRPQGVSGTAARTDDAANTDSPASMAHPVPSGIGQGLTEKVQALLDQLSRHSPVGEVSFYSVLLFGILSYALEIVTSISHGVDCVYLLSSTMTITSSLSIPLAGKLCTDGF